MSTRSGKESPRGPIVEPRDTTPIYRASALSRSASVLLADKSLGWWIGDWARYGEGRDEWGDKYRKTITVTGKSYGTIANAKSVADAFSEFTRRRVNLSFKHHAEVAGHFQVRRWNGPRACAGSPPAAVVRVRATQQRPPANGRLCA